MDSPNDLPLPPGTLLAGKYEIRRRLGSGGMGAVYEARHVRMNKRVAVKVIHPQFAKNGEAVGRFLREAEAASRIRHPNVIDVVDIDERHDPPFMVLEYLEGRALSTVLEKDVKLPVGQCAALMMPVLSAVAAAHDGGIVHRDLKPENVFIARAGDGSIRPVVLDFGVAKIEASSVQGLTQTNAMVGTVVYMSPEQARDSKRVDAKSDQYTLGVILYECITGVRPCDGDSLYMVLNAIVEGKYTPLRERAPGLPPAFEAIVTRAMSVDPAQRFSSVKAMADALAPLAEGQRFQFSRESWATEFAFGSTMSADGLSDSAVARAVEAVVGAKPGALSANEHAERVSTPAPLAGPTIGEAIPTPIEQSPELAQPARSPAPSTLGGSSIEVPSPLIRAETVAIDTARDKGHRGLAFVLIVSAIGLITGAVFLQRNAPAAAQSPTSAAQPTLVQPDAAFARPPETVLRARTEEHDSGAMAAPEQPTVNSQLTVNSARPSNDNSQTPPSAGRPGRRPPAGASTSTATHQPVGAASTQDNTRPTTTQSTTNTATQTPPEGPRQVGGGFVL